MHFDFESTVATAREVGDFAAVPWPDQFSALFVVQLVKTVQLEPKNFCLKLLLHQSIVT